MSLSASSGFIVSMGRFFFRFGLMVFFASLFIYTIFASVDAVPKTQLLYKMKSTMSLSLVIGGGVATAALGVMKALSASAGILGGRFLTLQALQLSGIAQYLAFTVPSVTGIIYISQTLVSSLGSVMPSESVTILANGISVFLSMVGSFAVLYYVGYRIGILPEE